MQETEAYVTAWVMIGAALLLAAATVWSTRSAMSGQLGVNPGAGIRIAATMRDGSAWRAGHAAAWPIVRAVAVVSVVLALSGVVLVLLGHPVPALAVAFIPTLLVLGSLVPTVRRARAAAEAAPPGT